MVQEERGQAPFLTVSLFKVIGKLGLGWCSKCADSLPNCELIDLPG